MNDTEQTTITTKQCRRCGEVKSASDFYPNRRTRDRLTVYCKACCKAATRQWSKQHPEQARRWREGHREQVVESTRRWRAKHPDQVREQWERRRRRRGMKSHEEARAHRADILDRYVAGTTLAEIGAEFGITRQRAHQIIQAELRFRKMRLVRAFRLVPLSDPDPETEQAEGEASA